MPPANPPRAAPARPPRLPWQRALVPGSLGRRDTPRAAREEVLLVSADTLWARLCALPGHTTRGSRHTAACPAHDDRRPSLTFRQAAEGRILLHCHAGCAPAAVLAALGAAPADLFPPRAPGRPDRDGFRETATYPYFAADGRLLYEVVRRERGRGEKSFRQRRPDGAGGWIWDVHGVERTLYRLPQLQAADPRAVVFVPEGEKDVERLAAAGFVATCNSGGAGQWPLGGAALLAGRRVVVLPDHDPVGQRHAAEVAAALRGTAAAVAVLPLPDLPPKGDVSDWLDAGHGASELALLAEVALAEVALAARAARVAPAASAPPPPLLPAHPRGASLSSNGLPIRTAREIVALSPDGADWLLPGFVARGVITELSGPIKKAGKSTWALDMAAALVRGGTFLGEPATPTGVLLLSEQNPASFSDALRRAGLAAEDRVSAVLWAEVAGRMGWPDIVQAATADALARGAGLLVVDTLGQWAGLRGDAENNAGAALEAMDPLQKAAAQGLAVLLLRHDRKSGGAVGDSARGSTAYGGASDILLQLIRPEGAVRPTIRKLSALSRFDETPTELVIERTAAGYVALGTDPAVAAAEAETYVLAATAAAAQTVETLVAQSGGMTRPTIQRVLARLVAAGRLRRTGTGHKGDPFRYAACAAPAPRDAAQTPPPGVSSTISAGAPAGAALPPPARPGPAAVPGADPAGLAATATALAGYAARAAAFLDGDDEAG